MQTSLPIEVICDDCGSEARVRSYGRVEYDWPTASSDGHVATMPTLTWARLTVDCPNCGVKQQEVYVGGLAKRLGGGAVMTHSTTRCRQSRSPKPR